MALGCHHAEPGPSGGDLIPATQFLTSLECSIITFICSTERVCAAKGVMVTQ